MKQIRNVVRLGKKHVRKGEAALNLYRTFFFRFSFKASSASKNVNSHTNNCPNRSPLGHPQCIEQLNLPDILQLFSYSHYPCLGGAWESLGVLALQLLHKLRYRKGMPMFLLVEVKHVKPKSSHLNNYSDYKPMPIYDLRKRFFFFMFFHVLAKGFLFLLFQDMCSCHLQVAWKLHIFDTTYHPSGAVSTKGQRFEVFPQRWRPTTKTYEGCHM